MAQILLAAATGAARIGAGAGLALGRSLASNAASFAAGAAERLIFGGPRRRVEGPRLDAFRLQSSTEGAPIPRLYGRARLAGQIIWASDLAETLSTTEERSGKGGRIAARTTTTEYLYAISVAIGLCEGPIDGIGRIWADGQPFDASRVVMRVYRGTEDQLPDAAISAALDAGQAGPAPAFRGLAYVVFDDLPLREFGNRLPQFQFEVFRALREDDPAALENALTGVNLIPGSGEFALGTTPVLRRLGEGRAAAENVHNAGGGTDIEASLDALLAQAPNMTSVSLVVAWFGTDLRAGHCEIRPGVETAVKETDPYLWRAGGVGRDAAYLVSLKDGRPAYGGTPADRSVVEAIAAIRARGLEVMLHPFILMDIPSGNGRPDPGGGGEQPAYPWRGRIGVGAADGTPAAAAAIAAFFGAAAPAHFSVAGGPGGAGAEIVYSGPAEWSFRRFILHLAHLAALAGGVDRFLLGSELRGLTTARAGPGVYPAAAALAALAADVRAILGTATKIAYAADWSEYFGHQPTDGSGDVHFHLDPVWADPNIDFVAIDYYLPLSDWRRGGGGRDAGLGFSGPYDRAYLAANVEGGERYDYYYASEADRVGQIRSPIADGAYGEDWIFRPKDLRGWWSNLHFNRPGGVRASLPTAWVPQSKPILLAEVGAPAVEGGARAPNLFLDPKSSESALPPGSSGARDDLAQRRYLEALIGYWRDPAKNPISSVYGGPMIDADRIHVWAWDARPFPHFPARADVWGDGANWERGHWLNGRLARAPVGVLIEALARPAGLGVDASAVAGAVGGYVLDRPLSPRAAIEPLADLFQIDMIETPGAIVFRSRKAAPDLTLGAGDLAARASAAVSVRLADAAELPAAVRLGFLDEAGDYAPAIVEAREPGAAGPEARLEAAVILDAAEARSRAEALLAETRAARARIEFSLPPTAAALEPGDVVMLDAQFGGQSWRVTEIADAGERRIEAERVHPSAYEGKYRPVTFRPPAEAPVFSPPAFGLLDLPLLEPGGSEALRLAAFSEPWPGGIALWRGAAPAGEFAGVARLKATLGRLDAALGPAASGRWRADRVRVRLAHGAFQSRSEEETLAGANLLAVETAAGFELLKFADAELGPDGIWTLRRVLRGEKGTEDCAALGAGAGARVVLLNAALAEIAVPDRLIGETLVWRAGPETERPESAAYGETTFAYRARARLPLAPVHLRAAREAQGVRLSFSRRSRLSVDDLDRDPPLGEAFERYRLTIFAAPSGPALRVIEATAPFAGGPDARPNVLYTNEMIAADFGAGGLAAAPDAAFEVRQISDIAGPGLPARRRFNG